MLNKDKIDVALNILHEVSQLAETEEYLKVSIPPAKMVIEEVLGISDNIRIDFDRETVTVIYEDKEVEFTYTDINSFGEALRQGITYLEEVSMYLNQHERELEKLTQKYNEG